MNKYNLLTVGGLDAAGNTGIVADRNALSALGFDPVTLVSGVFLDNGEVAAVKASTVERQLKAFFDADRVKGMKTGLLATRENVETISTFFEDHKTRLHNLVVDVFLENENRLPLLTSTAISLLKMRLLPMATLAVAYLSEAGRLAGISVEKIDNMKEAAEAIRLYGPKMVLVRADRIIEDEWVDILYDGNEHQFLFTKVTPDKNPRFERDRFAAAAAAYLARGCSIREAAEAAKEFVRSARPVATLSGS